MAILMLPYLAAATSDLPFPRLTIVSSDTHYWAKLNSEETKADKILEKLNDKAYCNYSYGSFNYPCDLVFIRLFLHR